MGEFFKRLIPCTKLDLENQDVILSKKIECLNKEFLVETEVMQEILQRLCNLECILVDGQMRETLERLRNIEAEMLERLSHIEAEMIERLSHIEAEMIERLSHIEEKEDWLMRNNGGNNDERKIRIKLLSEEK